MALGDLTLDIVIGRHAALAGGTDVGGAISLRAGGSAANTARAFAALGGRATFVGAVGDDAIGRRLAAMLRSERVTARLARVRRPTARLAVLLGAGGERSFIADRGAADGLRPAHLRATWFSRADWLHLPAYSLLGEPLRSAALAAIGHARRSGGLISLDLASRRPLLAGGRGEARALVGTVAPDLLLANADEARALVGADSGRLLELAPLVVVKQGARGCSVMWRAPAPHSRSSRLAVPTRRLATTDTTGAGDAFDAGFLHALIESGAARSPNAAGLRRAAGAGHRAAVAWLRRPRPELVLG